MLVGVPSHTPRKPEERDVRIRTLGYPGNLCARIIHLVLAHVGPEEEDC